MKAQSTKAQSIVEIQDKSKSFNGQISTKSILVSHISCIDQDIRLENISVGQSAWQFSVYMFGKEFIVSSKAFKLNDNETKIKHLEEIQQTLKDLLNTWEQVNNKMPSKLTVHCPN